MLRVIVAVVCLAAAPLARAQSLSAALPDDRRIVRLEQWLHAVYEHDPGTADRHASFIALWKGSDLEKLLLDTEVLARVMRNPKLRQFTIKRDGPAFEIRYTRGQVDRLRILGTILGCGVPAANLLCGEAVLLAAREPDLKRLLTAVQAEPPDDMDNGVLRRGALLHTDIAVLVPESERGPDDRPVNATSILIEFNDGQQRALTAGPLHWAIARMLLDAVKPAGLERPAPERDEMVRHWYQATASWLLANEHFEEKHFDRGREIFPDDALLQFFSGTVHEAQAGPRVQTMIRGATLPSGVTLGVKSARAEFRQAEGFFRRALELDPRMTEARLRLGHALLMQEHYADAATELRKTLDPAGDPLLQFYTVMFLGAAEEALGKPAEAAEWYSSASKLYPTSQSPRVALSALARRRGDRDGAWRSMQQVFALPNDERDRDDPWWTYTQQQGRAADLMLENVRLPFLRK